MSAYGELRLRSLRRYIRLAWWTRAAFATAASVGAVSFTLDCAAGQVHAWAFLGLLAAAFFTASVVFHTLTLRGLRRQEAALLHELRPRPDYAAIAAMEAEIWGHPFRHEGAPYRPGMAVRRPENGGDAA